MPRKHHFLCDRPDDDEADHHEGPGTPADRLGGCDDDLLSGNLALEEGLDDRERHRCAHNLNPGADGDTGQV